MAVAAIAIRRCNSAPPPSTTSGSTSARPLPAPLDKSIKGNSQLLKLDRNTTDLYFTKHARCRMKCRQISQQEVKDILANGTINYNKSDLQNSRGPTYAVEGITKDRQHVRVIFAPKQSHLTVVTVIDLEEEHACNCD